MRRIVHSSIPAAAPWLLALALGAGIVRAQADASEGSVMAIAQGLSVDGATVVPGAGAGTLLLTRSEFSSLPPSTWTPVAGVPDWSTVLAGAPGIDLDGFSIGYDYIQSTPTGFAAIPPGNWAGITFSVTRATTAAAGSLIAGEVATPGGAAADVFFYVLPGSALPPPLVDRTMRSQDSTEVNLHATGSPGDIDAHDVYVGLIHRENPQLVPTLPFHSAFFTVTGATVSSVPLGWWGAAPPSGATILRRDWTGSAWGTPYPFLTPATLGLMPGEDIDALAVDLIHGHVLFSTTRPAVTPGATLRDPILYHKLGGGPGHHVYTTSPGTPPGPVPVSTRIGLVVGGGIDDVDGICALDPGPAGQIRLNSMLGTSRQPLLPSAPTRLSASVFRRRAANNLHDEFVTYGAGWPQQAAGNPGLAFVGVTLGPATNPYTTAGAFPRPDALSPYFAFDGHPHRYVLGIPNHPVFVGAPVHFVWAAIDLQNGTFDVSHPVGIDV